MKKRLRLATASKEVAGFDALYALMKQRMSISAKQPPLGEAGINHDHAETYCPYIRRVDANRPDAFFMVGNPIVWKVEIGFVGLFILEARV